MRTAAARALFWGAVAALALLCTCSHILRHPLPLLCRVANGKIMQEKSLLGSHLPCKKQDELRDGFARLEVFFGRKLIRRTDL